MFVGDTVATVVPFEKKWQDDRNTKSDIQKKCSENPWHIWFHMR